MPGHKRNISLLDGMDPFQIDITEISGFDNLHHAQGVIKEAMDNAADFFEVDRTWFLVNGSSCGILAAIHSVTDIGDRVVIGRNCHKAVYNALALRSLQAQYLYPEYIQEYGINGGYDPKKLEQIFKEYEGIKAVVITSPTYDGIVSDVKAIADITHKYGAVLIVDEAHGAHLGISDELPVPAYHLGADIVIESTHKTLPALTQTGVLHLCGNRIYPEKIEKYLGVYQSSSPSYVLMGSIDKCIRQLQATGREQMKDLLTTVRQFRENVNKSEWIKVPGKELKSRKSVFDVDATKLIIYVDPSVCDGKKLADILREKYHFEMEMESVKYVLGIATICDKKSEIARLGECLKEIDESFSVYAENRCIPEKERPHNLKHREQAQIRNNKEDYQLLKNEVKCSVYQAENAETKAVRLEDSKGNISGEFLYLYPPGIPLLVPGEVISEDLLEQIKVFQRKNMNINGLKDKDNCFIDVLKEK